MEEMRCDCWAHCRPLNKKLEALELQSEGMRMLLEQFRDNLHLHQHDAKVPVEECPEPPCRKVMRYAEKRKCPYNHSDHKITGFLPIQNCPNCS